MSEPNVGCGDSPFVVVGDEDDSADWDAKCLELGDGERRICLALRPALVYVVMNSDMP